MRALIRSKTFPRIAQAMAEQWGAVGGILILNQQTK